MAQQDIIIGTADAKQGDTLFSAFTKTQANFTELFDNLSTQPENLVVINAEADFTTQDATTITLTPGLFYQIGASFSTAKRFITQGATLRGLGLATTLTYTGAGSMFTNTLNNFDIANIIVDCPSATVFECIGDDTGNPAHRVNAASLQVNNCVKLLTSTGAGAQVFDLIQVGNVTGPVVMSFSGTVPAVVFHFSEIGIFGMVAGSIGFDFNSVISNEIELSNVIMFGDSSATAISGLTTSGNITIGNLGSVASCGFSSFTTPLSGISESDVRWNFGGNAGIKNSRNAADIFLIGGSETITTGSAGDWQEIGVPSGGGVSWSSDIADRFTVGTNGVLTYIGESDIEANLSGRATVEKTGGGSNIIEVRFAVNWNGLVTDGGLEKSRAQTQNSDPTTVPIGALVTLSENDNVRMIFSNVSGSSDIIASVSSIEVSD